MLMFLKFYKIIKLLKILEIFKVMKLSSRFKGINSLKTSKFKRVFYFLDFCLTVVLLSLSFQTI